MLRHGFGAWCLKPQSSKALALSSYLRHWGFYHGLMVENHRKTIEMTHWWICQKPEGFVDQLG
jgi:hypothetical protein